MAGTSTLASEDPYELIRRVGPSVQDYIAKFIEFLHLRTGFRFENFRTPHHLQRLLDELSFNRVPLSLWQSILTAVLRIANMSENMSHGLRHFGAFFIDALCWIFKRLSRIGLLRISIFLFGWNVNPLIGIAIGMIYYAIEYFLFPLWDDLSLFIQSRLISAPYYRHFVTM